ncbi:hypothetical protein OHB00_03635 [Streptomyces sp. NBC_00631]
MPVLLDAASLRDRLGEVIVDVARMKRIADGSDPTPAVCVLRRTE